MGAEVDASVSRARTLLARSWLILTWAALLSIAAATVLASDDVTRDAKNIALGWFGGVAFMLAFVVPYLLERSQVDEQH